MPYLPYEEPGITTILSLASFLLLLNGIRYGLDRILYCGIIGEILIGMIWGLPVGGTAWLSKGTQETVQAYGYLGLIGLVFEGGLSMNLSMLRKTVFLSISIATVGLLMPIALSFILLVLPFPSSSATMYPTPLAGFSAGASLCSTSLGTTFAILSSANLLSTRVGTVLVGAAMMDDVVGLVMVNIVTTLGDGGMGGWQIARPIAASFGLLLTALAVAPYILKPIWNWLCIFLHVEEGPVTGSSKKCFRTTASQLANRIPHIFFMLSTAVLIIFVTIASYIEASVLFAAFIAGGVVKFLCRVQAEGDSTNTSSPSKMYKIYYKSLIEYILAPFFFASIGFSIPITDMFRGSIVWKGAIYSILMVLAKGLVCLVIYLEFFIKLWTRRKPNRHQPSPNMISAVTSNRLHMSQTTSVSLGPPHTIAILVGFAMISRGEIGFLIASLSQSSGTLGLQHRDGTKVLSSSEDIFLVIVWAVVFCTITGPIGVGIIARRIRRLNSNHPGWI